MHPFRLANVPLGLGVHVGYPRLGTPDLIRQNAAEAIKQEHEF